MCIALLASAPAPIIKPHWSSVQGHRVLEERQRIGAVFDFRILYESKAFPCGSDILYRPSLHPELVEMPSVYSGVQVTKIQDR